VDDDRLTNRIFPGPTGRENRIVNWFDLSRSQ
jgi:hypothetical protein